MKDHIEDHAARHILRESQILQALWIVEVQGACDRRV